MKKVKITMELVVNDADNLSWIPQNIWDQLEVGEGMVYWKTKVMDENVEPIEEELYE